MRLWGDNEECPENYECSFWVLLLSRSEKSRDAEVSQDQYKDKKRPYVARKMCATQGLKFLSNLGLSPAARFYPFDGFRGCVRFPKTVGSLPLDGAGGLRGQVEEDAVDALDLGGDAGHDLMQNGVRDLLDGGGHGILGIHGADDGGYT